jgi:hypothetical protein
LVDDSWPVEIRFIAERAADRWEADLRHAKDNDCLNLYVLRPLLKRISDKMSGNFFSRLRAKDWKLLTTEIAFYTFLLDKDFISAEKKLQEINPIQEETKLTFENEKQS